MLVKLRNDKGVDFLKLFSNQMGIVEYGGAVVHFHLTAHEAVAVFHTICNQSQLGFCYGNLVSLFFHGSNDLSDSLKTHITSMLYVQKLIKLIFSHESKKQHSSHNSLPLYSSSLTASYLTPLIIILT